MCFHSYLLIWIIKCRPQQYNYFCFREKMHEGVIKDVERQQRRKIENLYILEKQNELTKKLKKELGN